ncbi:MULTISPECIES: hypothetical protein [unclassified Streptomyces]|uniref:hypothetical protein n=1 Tax=unclassified Streptomyces TaxID=2593676 RepID=UPI002DD7A23A|nr:hypothetical protein [Streptomyces sp. NBC_01775]WSB81879.1 hypothetical protein OHB04_34765 [Streptomyces sp. NBC_01775]WSS46104.1 hypothetical protein OG220_05595 [Streptomyces sp. NBC_01187]
MDSYGFRYAALDFLVSHAGVWHLCDVNPNWQYGSIEELRAPITRVIATCGLPRIPAAWLDQLAPGGAIVANLGYRYRQGDGPRHPSPGIRSMGPHDRVRRGGPHRPRRSAQPQPVGRAAFPPA